MTVRVVALGDSISCGQGVGLSVPPGRTWPALLARAVPGGRLLPLARAGSRVRDVRREQLPAALDAEPHLATLLVGLNDVSRSGFDAEAFDEELRFVVRELRDTGAIVLLGRLHDPCLNLPLPRRLRDAVRARLRQVNGSIDQAAVDARPGKGGAVLLLDLARVTALADPAAWAVDRLHPAPTAHSWIAAAAAAVLSDAGLEVLPPQPERLPARAPGPLQAGWWSARHGLPWLVAHSREVLLPALSLARP